MPKCKLCSKEMVAKTRQSNYLRCLSCRVYPDGCPSDFAQAPSSYTIQFHNNEIIKESITIDNFIIDLRPHYIDGINTSIGRWYWSQQLNAILYEKIIEIEDKVFDFEDLIATRQKLKMIITFL